MRLKIVGALLGGALMVVTVDMRIARDNINSAPSAKELWPTSLSDGDPLSPSIGYRSLEVTGAEGILQTTALDAIADSATISKAPSARNQIQSSDQNSRNGTSSLHSNSTKEATTVISSNLTTLPNITDVTTSTLPRNATNATTPVGIAEKSMEVSLPVNGTNSTTAPAPSIANSSSIRLPLNETNVTTAVPMVTDSTVAPLPVNGTNATTALVPFVGNETNAPMPLNETNTSTPVSIIANSTKPLGSAINEMTGPTPVPTPAANNETNGTVGAQSLLPLLAIPLAAAPFYANPFSETDVPVTRVATTAELPPEEYQAVLALENYLQNEGIDIPEMDANAEWMEAQRERDRADLRNADSNVLSTAEPETIASATTAPDPDRLVDPDATRNVIVPAPAPVVTAQDDRVNPEDFDDLLAPVAVHNAEEHVEHEDLDDLLDDDEDTTSPPAGQDTGEQTLKPTEPSADETSTLPSEGEISTLPTSIMTSTSWISGPTTAVSTLASVATAGGTFASVAMSGVGVAGGLAGVGSGLLPGVGLGAGLLPGVGAGLFTVVGGSLVSIFSGTSSPDLPDPVISPLSTVPISSGIVSQPSGTTTPSTSAPVSGPSGSGLTPTSTRCLAMTGVGECSMSPGSSPSTTSNNEISSNEPSTTPLTPVPSATGSTTGPTSTPSRVPNSSTPTSRPVSNRSTPSPSANMSSLSPEATYRPSPSPAPNSTVSSTPTPSTNSTYSPAPTPIPNKTDKTTSIPTLNTTQTPTPKPTPKNKTDSTTFTPALNVTQTPTTTPNKTKTPTSTPTSNFTQAPTAALNMSETPTPTPVSKVTKDLTPTPSPNRTHAPTPTPTLSPKPTPSPTSKATPSPLADSSISGDKSYIVGIRTAIEHTTFCTGALIAPKFVLTSNLCKADNSYVSIGTVKRSASDDGGQHSKVAKRVSHPKYDPATRKYDFLILELETASSKTPVTLPSASQTSDSYGQYAQILGWNSDDDSMTRTVLLSTTMMFLNQTDCARMLSTTIYESQVCAYGLAATSACHVNEGSPLISRIAGKDTLAGLVCYKNGCDQMGAPTLFSLTSSVRDWIKSTAGV